MMLLNNLAGLLALGTTLVGAHSHSHKAFDGDSHSLYSRSFKIKATSHDPHYAVTGLSHNPSGQAPSSSYTRNAFYVDGKNLPDVPFDIGDSYAGQLPVTSAPNEKKKPFFWYFPSSDKSSKKLTFVFTAGPKCSPLWPAFHQQSPILWGEGMHVPKRNPYSWTNLTALVYVELPFGSGYGYKSPADYGQYVSSEALAREFTSWLQIFLGIFTELQDKDFYLQGDADATPYLPRIADIMINSTAVAHTGSGSASHAFPHLVSNFKGAFKGLMIWSPLLTSARFYNLEIGIVDWAKENQKALGLNSTYVAGLEHRAEGCGYSAYIKKTLAFPPIAPDAFLQADCNFWHEIKNVLRAGNSCLNMARVTDRCPIPFDALGFEGVAYAPGFRPWFDKPEVKKVFHASDTEWKFCSEDYSLYVQDVDNSSEVYNDVLPRVIEATNRTVLAVGALEMGTTNRVSTLLILQTMVWADKMGFAKKPSTPFDVPGKKSSGIYATERGLTYVEIPDAGLAVGADQPASAYKMIEYLVGQTQTL